MSEIVNFRSRLRKIGYSPVKRNKVLKVCIAQALLTPLDPFMHPPPLSHRRCWSFIHFK